MNIVYIVTILFIYLLFMLVHKTEKTQNLITWLAVTMMLILCYNVLVCTIYTFIGILCTIPNLIVANIIVVLALLTILIKNKKIQKYYIKKLELAYVALFLILVIFIGYKQYGFPLNLKYKTTDASSHYYFADQFSKKSTLLYKGNVDDVLGVANPDFRLPGAYVNEGILFKIFGEKIQNTDLFIIFDLSMIYIAGILFYCLLNTYAKDDIKKQVLAVIFSIMYLLGYQLNSILYGYVYLTLALDIVIALLLVISNYEKEEISYKVALSILSLLSFGIFFSYAYFIPIIFIAMIINIVAKSIRNKQKIISEENVIEIMLLIVIPLILGATYFIILPLAKGIKTEISTITVDGAIYKNYITNLLPYILIIISNIILSIKTKQNKTYNFSGILFILSILFAVILFIGKQLGKVSEYYFFKAYYIIWPLAIINTYIAICNILAHKNKIITMTTYTYIGIYLIVIILFTLTLKINIGINDIFYHNVNLINNENYALENSEIQLLKKVEEPIKDYQIYILAPKNAGRTKWLSVLHQNEHIYIEQIMNSKVTIEKWLREQETKYYLAYYNDYEKFEEEVKLDSDNKDYKIIFANEAGFILERIDSIM